MTHLVSESRDRELRVMERIGVRAHLWICRRCRLFTRNVELLGQAMRLAEKEPERIVEADDPSSREAVERIRQALSARRGGSAGQD